MKKTSNPILALIWDREKKGREPRGVSLRDYDYDGAAVHGGIQLPDQFAVTFKCPGEALWPNIEESWEQLGRWLDEAHAHLNERAAERLANLPASTFPFRSKSPRQ